MSEQNIADIAREVVDEAVEDFDAYWADYGKRGTPVKFMGEVVTLPASIPLRFQTEATRLQDSESLDDIAHLVDVLLPDAHGALQRWLDNGIDVERLGIFLIYATRKIAGADVTFAEAADQYYEQARAKQAAQQAGIDPEAGDQSPT